MSSELKTQVINSRSVLLPPPLASTPAPMPPKGQDDAKDKEAAAKGTRRILKKGLFAKDCTHAHLVTGSNAQLTRPACSGTDDVRLWRRAPGSGHGQHDGRAAH